MDITKSDYIPEFTAPVNVSQALKVLGLDRIYISLRDMRNDVRRRFRTLSKQYHPDTGHTSEEYKKITQANRIIKSYLHKHNGYHHVNITVSEQLKAKLKKLSKEHNQTVSDIVRKAIENYIKGM